MRCSYIHAGLIERLAQHFTSDAMPSSWGGLNPHNEQGKLETVQPPLFHEGRAAFVREFGREFARHLIQGRRELKRKREGALAYCLLLIANAR